MIGTLIEGACRAIGVGVWQSFPENEPISNARIIDFLRGSGKRSRAGEVVSVSSALGHSPIWACVSLIAESMSTLPITLKRRLDRGATPAVDHPSFYKFARKIGNMTTNLWVHRTMTQALLYEGSYSRIFRDKRGNLDRVELGSPDRCIPYPVKGGGDLIAYQWTGSDGTTTNLPASEVIHMQGLSISELGGMSIIDFARNTIGRHLAAEGFADDFFSNGSIPAGWFTTDGTLSKEYRERFLEDYHSKFASGSRFRAGVLQEGLKWMASGVNPSDAMLIPLLEISPYDAARYYRVPPYKLAIKGVQGKATAEQEAEDFVTSTLLPWVVKFESELEDKCLLESEKTYAAGGMWVDMNLDAQLRSDSQTRARVYLMHRQMNTLSPNEIRERDGSNPRGGGDNYDNPHTTPGGGTSGAAAPDPTVTPTVDPALDPANPQGDVGAVKNALQFVAQEGIIRIGRRLGNVAQRAAKDPARYCSEIGNVRADHRDAVSEMLKPVMAAVTRNVDCQSEVISALENVFEKFEETMLRAAEVPQVDLAGSVSRAVERYIVELGVLMEEVMSCRT